MKDPENLVPLRRAAPAPALLRLRWFTPMSERLEPEGGRDAVNDFYT